MLKNKCYSWKKMVNQEYDSNNITRLVVVQTNKSKEKEFPFIYGNTPISILIALKYTQINSV
jgi:hypothetical protein